MKTTLARPETATHDWKIVDATDQVLGRLAVTIANALAVGTNPSTLPMDTGDYVIVINAEKSNSPARKRSKRSTCFTVATWEERSIERLPTSAKAPEFIITNAVKGMLPKNKLANAMLTKLKVYRGSEHPHEAQQPSPLPNKISLS